MLPAVQSVLAAWCLVVLWCFFRCLRFLGCRFSRSFVMLFRRLSFLRSSWFSCYFFVFF